jgi:hypothetical protein
VRSALPSEIRQAPSSFLFRHSSAQVEALGMSFRAHCSTFPCALTLSPSPSDPEGLRTKIGIFALHPHDPHPSTSLSADLRPPCPEVPHLATFPPMNMPADRHVYGVVLIAMQDIPTSMHMHAILQSTLFSSSHQCCHLCTPPRSNRAGELPKLGRSTGVVRGMHPLRRSAARARGPKSSRRWEQNCLPILARRQDNSINLLAESRSKFGASHSLKLMNGKGRALLVVCNSSGRIQDRDRHAPLIQDPDPRQIIQTSVLTAVG